MAKKLTRTVVGEGGAPDKEVEVVVDAALMAEFPEESASVKARHARNAEVRLENMRAALAANNARLVEDKTRLEVDKAREEARVKADFAARQESVDALEAKIAEDEAALAELTAV